MPPVPQAYQAIGELEVYDQDNPPKKINEVDHLGHNYDNNEFYYLNINNDKIFINFLSIELGCNKCHQFFPSKLAMHKHLKTSSFSLGSRQLTESNDTK